MTTPNPITPPPELVQQWVAATESNDCIGAFPTNFEQRICTAAAQWGADQELEACCAELESIPSPLGIPFGKMAGNALRAARRPKLPSLKEQALEWLIAAEELHKVSGIDPEGIIRRALEAIPDD